MTVDRDNRLLFTLFAAMVAIALLLHRLWWTGFETSALNLIVVFAAFWVLLRPRSVTRFALMLGAEVVSVAIRMPDVGDHTLLIGVIGACILTHLGGSLIRTRRPVDAGALFARIAPFLRASVLVLYAAVALSKLNTTFLDPQLSCAAVMSSGIAWFDRGLLDGWQVEPAIWGTLIVEASLPLLLAFRRTRSVGLIVGLGFHLTLALAGNVPFTAVMLALYVAFLAPDLPARARAGLWARWPAPSWIGGGGPSGPSGPSGLSGLRAGAAFAAMVGCWFGGAYAATVDPALVEALVDNGTRLFVVALVGAAAGLGLLARGHPPATAGPSGGRAQPGAASLRPRHPVFALGVLVLVLNAASPYLGLKTATSFNMFSNLRTEPGHWNHLLIPEQVRIFGTQDRLVRITETNDPVLQSSADAGQLLVESELERLLRERPGSYASYTPEDGGGAGSEGPQLASADPRPSSGSRPTATLRIGPELGSRSDASILDKVAHFQPVPPAASSEPGC